jgi:hypothetical protein
MECPEWSPSAALAVECERRFHRNLVALARHAPDLADLARDATLVVTYLARCRDGTIGCRVETEDGERLWVGGNVIPLWATAQMLATLDLPDSGHLFLAPFDGAYALNELLRTTAEHQRLFVLESRPELFAGTLMVTDVREAFASGRVHLFVGPDLGEQAADYLVRHPWHAVPQHLVTVCTDPETVALYRDEVDLAERLVARRGRAGPASQVA